MKTSAQIIEEIAKGGMPSTTGICFSKEEAFGIERLLVSPFVSQLQSGRDIAMRYFRCYVKSKQLKEVL